MIKHFLILLLLATSLEFYSQTKISITKGYTSILTFPNTIKDVKNGNELEFIVKHSNNIIEVQVNKKAFPKKGTNIIVFTKDGSIYQVNLTLVNSVTNNIHSIKKENASVKGKLEEKTILENVLNKVSSSVNTITSVEDTSLSIEKEEKDPVLKKIITLCEANKKRKRRIIGSVNKSYNIILSIKDVAYEGDFIYLFYEIKNKGGQAYDVEWVNFFKSTNEKGDNTTSQRNLIKTFYIHDSPTRIEGKAKYQFTAVINKTSINENKAITVRIKELGGERNLILNVKHQIINNPTKL